jgi:hypothetical protein
MMSRPPVATPHDDFSGLFVFKTENKSLYFYE